MNFKDSDEARSLVARLDDMLLRAEGGELALSAFLTPKEQAIAQGYLQSRGAAFCFLGGYEGAERQRLYILPDYMESALQCDGDPSKGFSDFGYSTAIAALIISGSGYRTLTHRDFLGSLLGLGLERSVLGDIVLLGDGQREAIVFCDLTISEYILGEMNSVANDRVKVKKAGEDVKIPARKTQPIHGTVASARLDAVVAALCNLSREKARAAVVSGLVEIDFESEERPDRAISDGSVISVRGFGKYRVRSLADKTRKGRYRLEAEKYL